MSIPTQTPKVKPIKMTWSDSTETRHNLTNKEKDDSCRKIQYELTRKTSETMNPHAVAEKISKGFAFMPACHTARGDSLIKDTADGWFIECHCIALDFDEKDYNHILALEKQYGIQATIGYFSLSHKGNLEEARFRRIFHLESPIENVIDFRWYMEVMHRIFPDADGSRKNINGLFLGTSCNRKEVEVNPHSLLSMEKIKELAEKVGVSRADIEISQTMPPYITEVERPSRSGIYYKLNENGLCDYIIENNDFVIIPSDVKGQKGDIYLYENPNKQGAGVYSCVSLDDLCALIIPRCKIHTTDGKVLYDFYKPTIKNILNDKIRGETEKVPAVSRNNFDSGDYINFKNGLLNIQNMQLEPHSKNYYSLRQFSIDWLDGDIETPLYDEFLEHGFGHYNKQDKIKIIHILESYLGCIVTGHNVAKKLQRALILNGPSATGKSQVIAMAQAILGVSICRSFSLERMGGEFGGSDVKHARLSFSHEFDIALNKRGAGELKKLIAGDDTSLNQKNVDGHPYRHQGGFIIATNTLPPLGGHGGEALFRRLILIPFTSNRPKKRIDDFGQYLFKKEGLGILKKWINAYKKLQENHYNWEIPDVLTIAKTKWETQNDTVMDFLKECCSETYDTTYGIKTRTLKKQIQEAFRSYCRQEGLEENKIKIHINGFDASLRSYYRLNGSVEAPKRMTDGAYYGITLK